MKKLFKWLTMCLVIVLAMFTFAACTDPDKGGDGGDGGSGGSGGGGSGSATSYTITYTNGAGYTLSGAASAEAGDKVTVTVNVTEYDVRVTSVKYNNSTCSKADDGKYSFTMPSQNVTVSATSEKITAIEEDRPVSWQQEGALQIAKTTGNAQIKYDVTNTSCTDADVTVTSTNQAVIPSNAITQSNTTVSMGSQINGGIITIDLTKVSVGKTFIILDFDNNTSTSSDGTIIKEVEIVPEGELEENIAEVSITFNLLGFSSPLPDDLYIYFVDTDHIPDSAIPERQDLDITVDEQENQLSFVVGHTYNIFVGLKSDASANFEIDEIDANGVLIKNITQNAEYRYSTFTVTNDSAFEMLIRNYD
mgnify:CR=1 FL=1